MGSLLQKRGLGETLNQDDGTTSLLERKAVLLAELTNVEASIRDIDQSNETTAYGCCPANFPYLSENGVYCFQTIDLAVSNGGGPCSSWCGKTGEATTACGSNKQPCFGGGGSTCCPSNYPYLSADRTKCFDNINNAKDNGHAQWCGLT